ncbi:NAD(P)-dependent oxidoreductase [Kitasatospora aburaviensis]
MEKIAFLGLGRMGLPMARRLADSGHPLTVWNRTAGRAGGLTEAASPAEAAQGAGIVITMLADPAAVEAVAEQVADGLAPGTLWIDMSSIGPAATAALRDRLPDGVALVDAPVLGSVGPAATGGLTVLAGGRTEDLDRAQPMLGALGTVLRCGGLRRGAEDRRDQRDGRGVALVGETLALADSLGLSEELALGVLANGPLGGAVARARSRDSDFPIRLAAKDLGLAGGGPVLTAVRELLLADPDLAEQDLSRIVDAIRR